MGFLGPVSRLGDALVRPHDLASRLEPRARRASRRRSSRVVHLGFEVRVELRLPRASHDRRAAVQARGRAARARRGGQTVYVLAPVDEALERSA